MTQVNLPINPPLIILYGPPGSGKGTLAKSLQDLGMVILSSGNIIRNYITMARGIGDPLAERISLAMNAGKNIEDNDLFSLLEEQILASLDTGQQVVGDGILRTFAQAQRFEQIAISLNIQIIVFNLNTSFEVVQARLATRYCVDGTPYSSEEEAIKNCPIGRKVVRRGDDNPDTVKIRYQEYYNSELVIEDFCRRSPRFKMIQLCGELPREEIFRQVLERLEES
jgi:adenylate kinase